MRYWTAGLTALAAVAACGRFDFSTSRGADAGSATADSDASAAGDALDYVTPALFASAAIEIDGNPTITLTTQASQSGDLLVAGITIDNGSPISVASVADNAGNTYVSAGARAVTNGVATEIWYAANSRSGATSVTAILSGGPGGSKVWVAEFAGADPASPLDVAATDLGVVAATNSAPSVTTTIPHEIVFSILDSTQGSTQDVVSGNPFIQLVITNGDDSAYTIADQPGIYAAEWDMSGNGNECASTASFKPAPR